MTLQNPKKTKKGYNLMKKGTFKKFVALALVVMMLAATCIVNVASAANLTITFVGSVADGTAVHSQSADASVLTDGVKEGGYNVGLTVINQGSNKWTDYNLTFASKTTIDTIVVYAASPAGGGSWNIDDKASSYRLLVNGEAVAIDSVTVDRSADIYAVATIKFAAKEASTALIAIMNNVYISSIYEIEAFNSADMPEEPSSEEESSEEASSEEESSEPEVSEPEVVTATVYFDNASYNWTQVYAYIYTDGGDKNGEWPGVAMTKDEETGFYKVDLEGILAQWGKVIFTENSENAANRYPADMQPGLDIGGKDMIFGENANWAEYIPEVINPEEDLFDGKSFVIAAMDGKVWLNVEDDVKLASTDEFETVISELVWTFELKEDGKYRIVNKGTGRVLDIDCGVDADGTNVKTWENNDASAQRYSVAVRGDATETLGVPAFIVSIFPACSETRAIDANFEQANVQIWTYYADSQNQQFVMIPVADEEIEDPVEVNYAEGKKYTTAGPGTDGAPAYLSGGVDDGTLLTDGVLADGGKMGQVSFMGGSAVHTITIDLGAKRTDIDKLVFAGCRISGNRQFAALRIEVSNNGSTYTAIDAADYVQMVNLIDDPMNDVVVDFKNDVTARYVRLTCANTEYVFSVSEIQVIGYGAEGTVNPDDNQNPGDAGFAVVALVAMISLAAAVVVSKRKFN